MREFAPRLITTDEYARLTQKEKSDFLRNQLADRTMTGLIRALQKRDTRGNVELLQTELGDLLARNNPFKKGTSMYKIQQKMAKLQAGSQDPDAAEEGRQRYKILTNFVNAYKDKMFLSSSTGDAKPQEGEGEALTLQELRDQSFFERNDITVDFEQFMRVFSFENSSRPRKEFVMPGRAASPIK